MSRWLGSLCPLMAGRCTSPHTPGKQGGVRVATAPSRRPAAFAPDIYSHSSSPTCLPSPALVVPLRLSSTSARPRSASTPPPK